MKLTSLNILLIILLTTCQNEKSEKKLMTKKIFDQTDRLVITDLGMSWADVIRCNCILARTEDKYWDKELFFARDSVGGYGLIQFKMGNRVKIPISTPMMQSSKGQAWTEVFANDTLRIVLKGKPIDSRILRMHSYNVDFEMIHNGDTTSEQVIGHCSY